MATAGVDPDVCYEVGIALTEACANAVEHATPGAAAEEDGYQVTATIEGDRLSIEVTDSGPGFAVRLGRAAKPQPAPPVADDASAESGRGLFLIRALSDHVQFRNHPRRGAVVCFDRTLTYRDRARSFAHAS
jgi:serine/threonine-protein kinase RsbW